MVNKGVEGLEQGGSTGYKAMEIVDQSEELGQLLGVVLSWNVSHGLDLSLKGVDA